MNTADLPWFATPLCKKLERRSCLEFLFYLPVCEQKTSSAAACGPEAPTAEVPGPVYRRETQHPLQQCIRETLSCTHIPTRASHISYIHIHGADWVTLALKLPLYYSYFFAFVNACHTFTSPPPLTNVRCGEAVKVLTLRKSRQLFSQAPSSQEVHEALLGYLYSRKCLKPPTSPPVHFPTCLDLFL